MRIKILKPNGTTMHVWERKKYYPDEVHVVDDDLGEMFVKRRWAVRIADPKPEKRGPGRPRKVF